MQHRAKSGACVRREGGAGRIRRCVTGAVNIVALDTAHERRNDCRLMLIPLWLAGPLRSGVNAQRQGGAHGSGALALQDCDCYKIGVVNVVKTFGGGQTTHQNTNKGSEV